MGVKKKGEKRIVDASAGILHVKPSPLSPRMTRLDFSTIWGDGALDLNHAQRAQLIKWLQEDQ